MYVRSYICSWEKASKCRKRGRAETAIFYDFIIPGWISPLWNCNPAHSGASAPVLSCSDSADPPETGRDLLPPGGLPTEMSATSARLSKDRCFDLLFRGKNKLILNAEGLDFGIFPGARNLQKRKLEMREADSWTQGWRFKNNFTHAWIIARSIFHRCTWLGW